MSHNERFAPAAVRPITGARVLCLLLSHKGRTPLLRAIHHRNIVVDSRNQFVTRASRSPTSISKKVSPL
jgi:aspartyl/asparaginyl beta-hydroxylase (cupin superfamily)